MLINIYIKQGIMNNFRTCLDVPGRTLEEANGSPGWTRTNDQRINSPTLYQLSYRGVDGTSCKATLGWAL